MKAIKFKNFTDRDFTYSFDGVPYTFKAGTEIFLEDYKAEHFARHLADRELEKKDIRTDNKKEKDIIVAQCLFLDESVTPSEALDIEEKKKVTKIKKVEEEFADLKPSKKKKQ